MGGCTSGTVCREALFCGVWFLACLLLLIPCLNMFYRNVPRFFYRPSSSLPSRVNGTGRCITARESITVEFNAPVVSASEQLGVVDDFEQNKVCLGCCGFLCRRRCRRRRRC